MGIDVDWPVEGGSCPHMAMLLDSLDEVPSALASFYALGLRRNGWLYHRALPGQGDADRDALTDAGLPVAELESAGRFELCELPITEPPERWTQPLEPKVDEALARGHDAIWWSRFPVGSDEAIWKLAMRYDRHWEIAFHERPAVSLCVYIVGGLSDEARAQRMRDLREIHDHTLDPAAERSAAV
jgi:hypothetical protein